MKLAKLGGYYKYSKNEIQIEATNGVLLPSLKYRVTEKI